MCKIKLGIELMRRVVRSRVFIYVKEVKDRVGKLCGEVTSLPMHLKC